MKRTPSGLTQAIRTFKAEFLRSELARGKTITATARRLGIARTYLARLKRDLGIEEPRTHARPEPPLRSRP